MACWLNVIYVHLNSPKPYQLPFRSQTAEVVGINSPLIVHAPAPSCPSQPMALRRSLPALKQTLFLGDHQPPAPHVDWSFEVVRMNQIVRSACYSLVQIFVRCVLSKEETPFIFPGLDLRLTTFAQSNKLYKTPCGTQPVDASSNVPSP